MPSLETLLTDLTSGDATRAEDAVPCLVALGPTAVERLLGLLESSVEDVRWWSVRALAEVEDESARTALHCALRDPEPSVRQCAALGLRRAIGPADAPGLLRGLSDPDGLVRRLAGDALAALGPRAVAPLVLAARSHEPCTRIEAVRALARCGSPEAIPALMAALEDPSSLVCHWAERGLEDLGQSMVYFNP